MAYDPLKTAKNDLLFTDEPADKTTTALSESQPWKIMVVDDEKDIHQATRMVLGDYRYQGRNALLIDAYSAEQALQLIQQHPDTALIILDVIMESDTAGLELVHEIRNSLGNHDVRILLRTGQPGMFDQYQIAMEYGINDFKEKSDLTVEKLFASITTLLREYAQLQIMHRQRNELEASIDQLQAIAVVFGETSQAILVLDNHLDIKAANPAFSRVTGFDEASVLGSSPLFLRSERNDEAILRAAWGNLLESGAWEGELWCATKSRGDINIQMFATVLRDGNTDYTEIALQFSDITDIKEQQKLLLIQATRDPLTSLPNRNLFFDRLKMAISNSDRSGTGFALLFIDLDYFKSVNDRLGHKYGDQLLIEVGNRLQQCLRKSDTIARVGGDEFIALITNSNSKEQIEVVAKKINNALACPFDLEGRRASIAGSIGIALFPADATEEEQLLHHADLAMYQAKRSGRNTYCFYSPALVDEPAEGEKGSKEGGGKS